MEKANETKKPQQQEVAVNYLDAFEWHWNCDPEDRWHTSFIIDMVLYGKRYVLMKSGVTYTRGVTGEGCDKALKKFKKQFTEERNRESKDQQRRDVKPETLIQVPAMQLIDGELWDVARNTWGSQAPKAVMRAVSVPFNLGETKEAPKSSRAAENNASDVASLSDLELKWFAKIAERKGDAEYLAALRKEEQRRFEASKHLRQ